MKRQNNAQIAKLLRDEADRYESVVRQQKVSEEHGGVVVSRTRKRNEKMPDALRRAADVLEPTIECSGVIITWGQIEEDPEVDAFGGRIANFFTDPKDADTYFASMKRLGWNNSIDRIVVSAPVESLQVHLAWATVSEDGRLGRVFPITDYKGDRGEQSKAALADAKNQSPPSAIFVPLYANLRTTAEER